MVTAILLSTSAPTSAKIAAGATMPRLTHSALTNAEIMTSTVMSGSTHRFFFLRNESARLPNDLAAH